MNDGLTSEQKEYLQGFMAGALQRGALPYVGATADGRLTSDPSAGGANLAAEQKTVFGTPVDDLCKEELIKLEENPLDAWEKLAAHAGQNKFPDAADTFRFKFHGLFYVAPAQSSFMLRLRIPACVLTSAQLRGLAGVAEKWGGKFADITTRGNLQIREIEPKNILNVLTALYDLGLTSRGAGADNIRNITASPTSGIDPFEVIDVIPLARALHHYILNNRDLYGLPRKFNIAFDNGGSVSVAADTNDIGFIAVRVAGGKSVESGVYFRALLAGITGHGDFARDAGLLIKPDECLAVAAAMVRVFNENGDRTNRKKARLKYLIEKWGIPKFIEETQKRLALPLLSVPLADCEPRRPVIRHGHIGVFRQNQPGLNYIGAVVPVGRMTASQMNSLADAADKFGAGELRLTVFQNLLIPHVPDERVDDLKSSLVRMGFHHEATNVCGGLVACTGNRGCRYAATDTKGHAIELGRYLEKRVRLDRAINIHFTGCPHSCAQHYAGDVGLLGMKVGTGGEAVEGYNIVLGGGMDHEQGLARDIFANIPFTAVPPLVEKILITFEARKQNGETFIEFTRRHEVRELQEMFS